jgi:alanyl-tRNA synthetase
MDANELRRAFTEFFVARGHALVPSASLIPHDPTLLFTVAGMVPFKPYFLGDEVPPYRRATSVQKCMRAGGKHNDLDAIGTTARHLSFFEMLGNFSFGDYFKAEAIRFAWDLVTEVLGMEPDRIWVTVHERDDEAAAVWTEAVGLPPARVGRLGEDNWWQMAEVGPCGPCSELYFDRGPAFGPEGGPAGGGGAERYVEFWNLVFMQYNRRADGSLEDLPRKNIDTGAGLERVLALVQGVGSVFETDVLRPVVEAAEAATGHRLGENPAVDTSLRILADHARASAFLVADGVFPSNEGRGYVLRRMIRRAVLRAYRLGVERPVAPAVVAAVVATMGDAYPELRQAEDFVTGLVGREEERFRQTLRTGFALLDEELGRGEPTLSGEVAFRLHDTYGFPVDLTREIAAERGVAVELAGFEAAMAAQRSRARAAGATAAVDEDRAEAYRDLLQRYGTTAFTGYERTEDEGIVLAVLASEPGRVEVFVDRTPFYAEAGGQVGDTGVIAAPGGRLRVLDTTYALPGLIRHLAVVEEGGVAPGDPVRLSVDAERRDAIRRNHTGTHLLHWALRRVLGPHVRQQGSLVAPDRLRFDFSHFAPLTPEQIAAVEDLVDAEVLADRRVETLETSREEADALGAIAFFGDKYGERVRVVRAGSESVELCGGTHVSSLGMIGPLRIVSEGSIGANTRRIEALTGAAALAYGRERERILAEAAAVLEVAPEELPRRVAGLREQLRRAEEELKARRQAAWRQAAAELVAAAEDGAVVARRDGATREELRELALAARGQPGVRAVVLGGSPDGKGVALVAAVAKDAGLRAKELLTVAARLVGGGAGGGEEVAMAGGRDVARLDEALEAVRAELAAAGRDRRS